jgi:D-alanyl-D-alanine carboxypeptidase/D-alanyl-D-alanine-endopeptidase (penicillin-binding protein 4)
MTLGIELSKVLKSKGINIVSVNTAQEDYIAQLDQKFATPPYSIGEIIYEHRSQPMSDIIREVNVQSNNHYTEHLIRTIGRKINPNIYSDALQEGIDYVYRFLKARNIRTEALFLHDGCGLAPQDAASPNFFCDLLSYMYVKSNNSKTYFESLPKAGELESTLQNFMDGTKYEGKIAAKSGSIGGVQCFAGYLIDGDKKYAFTIMVNKFNGTRTQVRSAIEKYLESL